MKAKLLLATWVAAALMAAAPAAQAQFEHPDLKSGKRVVKSAIVLPPRVTVNKAGVKSNEPMIEEGLQVEAALPGLIARALEARGCSTKLTLLADSSQGDDTELKYAINDLQDRFEAVYEHLEKKPKDVRKARFTLGDEVTKINSGGAEVLVFVRGNGFLSTGGKKAFSLLIGGPGFIQGIYITVTVVDAQTGAVLYHGRSITTGNFVKNLESMAKPIDGSFKNFAKKPKSAKS